MFAVVISIGLLATTAFARQYNCTVDQSTCTGSGMQSIVVSGVRMCCPPSATFSLNNDVCKCIDTSVAEEPCRQGAVECVGALSSVRDSQDNVRCCMPGYALNHISNSYVNGQLIDVCTCTQLGGSGGMLSQVLGVNNGMSSVMMNGNPAAGGVMMTQMGAMPPFGEPGAGLNATELQDQLRQMRDGWRQFGGQFVQGARDWAHNFGRSMSNVGLDLGRSMSGVLQGTLQRTMVPLQRAVNGLFQSLFTSIPQPRI